MGLFGFKKPKSVLETFAESHPTSWYEKSTNLFLKVFSNCDDEILDASINLYCLKYFESFENIVQLRSLGANIDTVILGKELATFIEKLIANEDSVAMKVFLIGECFKSAKNPYIRFIKGLNHSFYGEGAFIISQLIFMDLINVDKDKWLYDSELFNNDAEDSSSKILTFLTEKELLNDEILNKIQENL